MSVKSGCPNRLKKLLKSLYKVLRLVALHSVCFLTLLSLHAETLHGRVVHVADGDTLTILNVRNEQTKIRLAGIDAPEKAQAFGQRAKEHLTGLVQGKEVRVETTKKDKYGRQVGQVLLNETDVNLSQLRAGLAWFYRLYEQELTVELRGSYAQAEQEARVARLGLWRDDEPVAPWVWRHRGRVEK